jgi:TRAP-type transport system periplasmic protein
LKWAPLVGALVIRKQVWDKIPAAAKAALMEAAAEAGQKNKTQGRSESEKSIAAMKEKGLKVQVVDEELEKIWRKEAERFYPLIRGSLVPTEIFDEVQGILTEYRAAGVKP